jgi:predicted O-methyltransferase YrrM
VVSSSDFQGCDYGRRSSGPPGEIEFHPPSPWRKLKVRVHPILTAGVVAARNVLLGGNAVSLSLLKTPKKMLEYVTECLFLYKALASKRGIPSRNVFDVFPCRGEVTIKLADFKGGPWFSPIASYTADLVSLCLICRLTIPTVVFEIGTLRGSSALHFALNTPDETVIYTLDLPKAQEKQPSLYTTVIDKLHIEAYKSSEAFCFEDTPVAPRIRCLFGDSAKFDFSEFHGKVDFFFIDGAHSYEYARSDTLNALKCCHKGSVIAWHDFGRVGVNGVSRWILELSKEHEICSIPGGSLAFMVVN